MTTRSTWGLMLAATAVILWVLFIGLALYDHQEALLFHPIPWVPNTPERLGLAFERLSLTTSDGIEVQAWWIPAPEPRTTILYCGGNVGNMGVRLPALKGLSALNSNLLLFDYRGYGGSKGHPTEQGVYRDAAAAWRWLVESQGLEASKIIIWGRSMGGAVAIWLATEAGIEPPGALIVEASFSSLVSLGSELYPWLPVKSMSRMRFDSLSRIRNLASPLLLAHSPGDEVVGISHGYALFEAAPVTRKRFLELAGHHHSDHLTDARYRQQLVDFIDWAMRRGAETRPAPIS